MAKYISGRSKITPQTGLSSDRYRYLSVSESEPNLGDPIIGPSAYLPNLIPPGNQYIVIGVDGYPGERYWIPNQGGIIPGSITIFDEGSQVGGLSSTTQLDFIGNSVVAEGIGGINPGYAVTITVTPPGNDNSVLFKNNGDFATDSRFTFDNGLFAAGDRITVGTGGTVITTTGIGSVGIRTANPTQELHLDGDFRITGTIYDTTNQPGNQGELIVKGESGLVWVTPNSVVSGAGGTIGQVQFHNTAGLVDGGDNFYYDFNNNRVGIGSTIPTQLLDVLGVSTFSGGVFVDTLSVGGNSAFTGLIDANGGIDVFGQTETDTLNVSELSTFGGNVDINASVDISTNLDVDGTTDLDVLNVSDTAKFTKNTDNTLGNTNTGGVQIDGGVGIDKNLTVGQTIQATNLNITGIGTIATFDFGTGEFDNIVVTGVSTLGNVVVDGNTVSTKSGAGNLIIDSDGASSLVVKDFILLQKDTESTSTNTGALQVDGGVGIDKSVNIGLNLDVDGITTTDTLRVGTNPTVSIAAILDEDDMSSNSDTSLATQQSIKAYVNNQVTAQDLDFAGDSGSGSIDLDSQTFTIAGTTNEIETSGLNQTLTIGLPNNVTVSGNLTVNGNIDLGNANSDTVTFNARVDSNILPSTNGTLDLGGTSNKWDNVYANTFIGAIIGNADSATKIQVTQRDTNATHYLTFSANDPNGSYEDLYGDDNLQYNPGSNDLSTSGDIVSGRGSGGVALTVNDSEGNANVTFNHQNGIPEQNGNSGRIRVNTDGTSTAFMGFELKDNVTSGVDEELPRIFTVNPTSVTPGSNNAIDLGSTTLKWNNVYANNFIGAIIGNADSATKLANARNFSISGDGTAPNVAFDGTANVDLALTLANTGVSAGTYGSSTSVGIFTVDSKGRLTAASNTAIDFGNATVDIANNLAGGAAGSLPYQSATDTTTFLAEPNANNKILSYNNSTNAPTWIDKSSAGVDNYVNSVSFSSGTLTLGRTGSLANLTALINLSNIGSNTFVNLSDTPANYNSAAGKVVKVNSSGNALEFVDSSTAGKTYTLTAVNSGSNVKLRLKDSNNINDDVLITAGSNITIDPVAAGGFTIAAASAPSPFVTGMIMMFSGSSAPSGWALCNGSNGTPDLRNRFVIGTGGSYSLNATGGSANSAVISHTHPMSHSHGMSHTHGRGTLAGTTSNPGNHIHQFTAGQIIGDEDIGRGGNNSKNVQESNNSTGGGGGHTHSVSITGSIATSSISNTGGSSISNTGAASNGVSGTNANLPPYYALAFIMKT